MDIRLIAGDGASVHLIVESKVHVRWFGDGVWNVSSLNNMASFGDGCLHESILEAVRETLEDGIGRSGQTRGKRSLVPRQ